MSNDDKSFGTENSVSTILNECVVSTKEWLSFVYIQIQIRNQFIVIFLFIFGWFRFLLLWLLAVAAATVVVYFRALLIRICSTRCIESSNFIVSSILVYFCHFHFHVFSSISHFILYFGTLYCGIKFYQVIGLNECRQPELMTIQKLQISVLTLEWLQTVSGFFLVFSLFLNVFFCFSVNSFSHVSM